MCLEMEEFFDKTILYNQPKFKQSFYVFYLPTTIIFQLFMSLRSSNLWHSI